MFSWWDSFLGQIWCAGKTRKKSQMFSPSYKMTESLLSVIYCFNVSMTFTKFIRYKAKWVILYLLPSLSKFMWYMFLTKLYGCFLQIPIFTVLMKVIAGYSYVGMTLGKGCVHTCSQLRLRIGIRCILHSYCVSCNNYEFLVKLYGRRNYVILCCY